MKKFIAFVSFFISCSSLIAQTCFFSSLQSFGGSPTNYSGNVYLDNFLTNEYNKLVYCFGVKPNSFYITEDGQPNAYASTAITNSFLPDGTVVLGLKLINQECGSSPSGTCVAMAVVMAHEFAHILDFKNQFVSGKPKIKELFADYMAGVYLHTRQLTYTYTDIREAANSIFSKGDTEFNSPLHHGTPQERMNALLAGYEFSRQKFSSGIYNISVSEAMNAAKYYLGF
jgi:ketosteroid isomerase-like protein